MKIPGSSSRIESLRAIHSLQKERGASCSYLSLSSRMADPEEEEFFQSVMLDAREITDLAFITLDHSSSCIWKESLSRIRALVDMGGQKKEMSPYKVVITFNILIGNVIDESLQNVIRKELNTLQTLDRGSQEHTLLTRSKHKSQDFLPSQEFLLNTEPIKLSRHRSQEYTTNDSLPSEEFKLSRSQEYSSKHVDNGHLTLGNDSPYDLARSLPFMGADVSSHSNQIQLNLISGLPPTTNISCLHRSESRSSSPMLLTPIENSETDTVPEKRSSALSAALESHPIDCSGKSINIGMSSTVRTDVQKIKSLLSILQSIVQLKESTGCERAMLSSLMALGPGIDSDRDESTTKLLNDLVVEEANQRMIIHKLQSACKGLDVGEPLSSMSRGSSSALLGTFLTPSKEMEYVQELIKNFDLEGLQHAMPLKNFWEIITIYIDQIHALELLLVEEVTVGWIRFDMNRRNSIERSVTSENHVVGQKLNYDVSHAVRNGNQRKLEADSGLEDLSKLKVDEMKDVLMNVLRGKNELKEATPDEEATPIKRSVDRKGFDIANLPGSIAIPPSHSLKEWEIDLYEIEFRKRIGRGLGGTTYLAKWNGTQVAVKVAAITDLGLEGWHTEVHSLKRLHHPHVIRLLGSIYNPSPQTYGLVLEYCNAGDLAAALQRPVPSNFFWKIADDVANGMSYLHRKNVLHRDIKPANVLLEGNIESGSFSAKLTDFGVAIMHQGDEEHTAETGTYRWMSPEVIRHEYYSFMADVYSYAVVCWQLVTHEEPFQGLSQIEAAGKVALEDARPPFPPNTPHLIKALIEKCWNAQPDKRLTFPEIAVELKAIHKDLSERDKSWLRAPHGHPVYIVDQRVGASSKQTTTSRRHTISEDSSKSAKSKDGKKGLFSIFFRKN